MHLDFEAAIKQFIEAKGSEILNKGLFGLEKENLRIQPDGKLALTPHPSKLGSALTHQNITTDFSESQIELIGDPFSTPKKALEHLQSLQKETVAALENDEMLWPMSMPCRLPEMDLIPIAHYGNSLEGTQRELYRKGLAERYGKIMQMVCGIHYNISFDDTLWETLMKSEKTSLSKTKFINEKYLAIARNFLRRSWMIVYLLGSSPNCDESYTCKMLKKERSKAVSLRLSRCGYTNPIEINVSYNDFRTHISDIKKAVETPYPPYTKIGLERDGEPIQLNDHILQIANEFYAPIRLKSKHGEGSLLEQLEQTGTRYLEIRIVDLNAMDPFGIDLNAMYFLHLFLIACLFEESPPIGAAERKGAMKEQEWMALHGQEIKKIQKNELVSHLQKLEILASQFDEYEINTPYQNALNFYQKTAENPHELPWGKILSQMNQDGSNFLEFGLQLAKQHHDLLRQ